MPFQLFSAFEVTANPGNVPAFFIEKQNNKRLVEIEEMPPTTSTP